MGKLYDRIMEKGWLWPDDSAWRDMEPAARASLSDAVVIRADNVAEYLRGFFRSVMVHLDQSGVRLLQESVAVNVAPPFPNCFIEHRSRGRDLGTLLAAVEDGKGWIVHAIALWESPIGVFPVAFFWYEVDPDGRPRHSADDAFPFSGLRCLVAPGPTGDEKYQARIYALSNHLCPAWMAISFMHCKNVTLTANEAPEKLNHARIKRGKKPLARYYTLEIEPMKQVLRHEGEIEHNGLKKALHICRGHFKDYRQNGLFGRSKGLYWWDAHVRGVLEEGAVLKGYRVKLPSRTEKIAGQAEERRKRKEVESPA